VPAKTKIYYYISPSGRNPAKNFIDSLAKNQKAKILRVFQYIREYGIRVPIQHIKKVKQTPFWEIRTLGKDNIRIIYAVVYKKDLLVIHGFIKKKQKTPKKELETALNRYREWLQRKPR